MCSRSRRRIEFPVLALALALGACDRETRPTGHEPVHQSAPTSAQDPRGRRYEANAYAIGQGQHLFRWMNCNGCHANGGGGMGPALMDDAWRYGANIEDIYTSIDRGRPNGMPSFHGKLTEEQTWQLAAYVRALSGHADRIAAPSRADAMRSIPPINNINPEPVRPETRP
jgi:cytochrome c oxidase cbb3-type subunit 3